VWGAFIELPEKSGFPATLGYVAWAITMIPCAAVALAVSRSAVERRPKQAAFGLAVGLLGAGGQLLLFQALRHGPAYLVFPLISLYPVLTVILAYTILKERARPRAWIGVLLAFPAIFMLSWQPPTSGAGATHVWLPLALAVFVMWGLQAHVMKISTGMMTSESLFFYMALGAVLLIPGAIAMTDFSAAVNWGFRGPYLAGMIQVLNSIGALCLVYALRNGPAIIVVPMTSLAPVLTVLISLVLYRVVPNPVVSAGLLIAAAAIYLMAE
jgi:drug/metabolite transporter (DMT)-like permease